MGKPNTRRSRRPKRAADTLCAGCLEPLSNCVCSAPHAVELPEVEEVRQARRRRNEGGTGSTGGRSGGECPGSPEPVCLPPTAMSAEVLGTLQPILSAVTLPPMSKTGSRPLHEDVGKAAPGSRVVPPRPPAAPQCAPPPVAQPSAEPTVIRRPSAKVPKRPTTAGLSPALAEPGPIRLDQLRRRRVLGLAALLCVGILAGSLWQGRVREPAPASTAAVSKRASSGDEIGKPFKETRLAATGVRPDQATVAHSRSTGAAVTGSFNTDDSGQGFAKPGQPSVSRRSPSRQGRASSSGVAAESPGCTQSTPTLGDEEPSPNVGGANGGSRASGDPSSNAGTRVGADRGVAHPVPVGLKGKAVIARGPQPVRPLVLPPVLRRLAAGGRRATVRLVVAVDRWGTPRVGEVSSSPGTSSFVIERLKGVVEEVRWQPAISADGRPASGSVAVRFEIGGEP